VKLTENITTYNVFVDPKFIRDKKKFIDIITPVIYQHLCEIYGMQKVTPLECIKNIEKFSETNLLPKAPEFFYYGRTPTVFGTGESAISGYNDIVSSGYNTFDRTGYDAQIQQVISGFNS